MKRKFNHAFIAFNCLCSILPPSFALPVERQKTSVLVSGSIAKIVTTSVDSRTFDVHKIRHEVPRSLLKRDGTWIVQAGDTGNGIAARLGIQFTQLALLNQNVDWNNLQIGQVLIIPCSDDSLPGGNTNSTSSFYTVVAGDTGYEIAASHGITFAQLEAFNPGVNWYNLQIGQTLILPGSAINMGGGGQNATTTATTATTSQTSSFTTTVSTTTVSTTSVSTTSASTTSIVVASDIVAQRSNSFLNPPSRKFLRQRAEDASIQAETVLKVSELPLDKDSKVVNRRSSILSTACSKTLTITSSKTTGISQTITPIQKLYNATLSTVRSTTSTISIVPSGTSSRTYTVKAGDTGYAIAAAYGFPFSDLDKANPGVIWTNLQIGQILNLPTHATAPYSNSSTTGPSINPTSSSSESISTRKSGTDIYITYSGPASNATYPLMSSWMSFLDLWAANQNYIGVSCSFASGSVTPNTASENAALKSSILSVSNITGVNPSFILALVMQESNGCVRAPTTSSWQGITNPGITQSFKGNGTCNSNGVALQPCPAAEITQMLLDGIAGSQGVGIVPALNQVALLTGQSWNRTVPATASLNATATITSTTSASARATLASNQQKLNIAQGMSGRIQQRRSDRRSNQISSSSSTTLDPAMLYYMAARIYNSGSIPADMDLSGPTESTRCYVSDIANRLMGWVAAPNTCYLS